VPTSVKGASLCRMQKSPNSETLSNGVNPDPIWCRKQTKQFLGYYFPTILFLCNLPFYHAPLIFLVCTASFSFSIISMNRS
jgi:hypothetical protein